MGNGGDGRHSKGPEIVNGILTSCPTRLTLYLALCQTETWLYHVLWSSWVLVIATWDLLSATPLGRSLQEHTRSHLQKGLI